MRRPTSAIESMSTSNAQDDNGCWTRLQYNRFDWVTMRPSRKGAHKVSRRHISSRAHHWKGRILDFKIDRDGTKRIAKVQHVYSASQLSLDETISGLRFPANYIFPSNCVEWEPLDSFTGLFEALHVDLGRQIYADCSPSELAARDIFFYDSSYVVPRRNGRGMLVPMPTPTLGTIDCSMPDSTTTTAIKRRIENDVQSAMKCTYGSHRAKLGRFLPLHVFVSLFRTVEMHRTPTMWICKGDRAFNFLPVGWDLKTVSHQGDTIKCAVIGDKVVLRYHIGKQSLSMLFPYRRWKLSKGTWEALDSDATAKETIDLHVSLLDDSIHDITVNDDWHLGNLREYLVLRFNLRDHFLFEVNSTPFRIRKEKSTLCRDIEFPQCIAMKSAH